MEENFRIVMCQSGDISAESFSHKNLDYDQKEPGATGKLIRAVIVIDESIFNMIGNENLTIQSIAKQVAVIHIAHELIHVLTGSLYAEQTSDASKKQISSSNIPLS